MNTWDKKRLLLLLGLSLLLSSYQQTLAQSLEEQTVLAALALNIVRFTTWPVELQAQMKDEIDFCVVGDNKTAFGIVDAQSAKNTDTADEKGYAAGKKVSGIKRHIVVDTHGLPPAIAVTTANVADREGTLQALSLHSSPCRKLKKSWWTVATPENHWLTRSKGS